MPCLEVAGQHCGVNGMVMDSLHYYMRCFTFAEMPWYQRKIAAAIFASPPTSTYEEALENFKKAEEITPLFYSMNLLMLGKCYINLNNKEKGMKYLKKAVEYTIKIPDDQKAHDEAEKLLKDLNA
ncbi:UNVERIFIED_CONTAM: Rmdn1 [Trichonephila clavipes]